MKMNGIKRLTKDREKGKTNKAKQITNNKEAKRHMNNE